MPSSTFFNLPDPKRQKLVQAIRQEIMRVPYEEISINKIIQTAQIPRGSFYQYFSDKDDMILMVLGDFRDKMESFTKQILRENGGDPFALCLSIVEKIAALSDSAHLCKIYHNLLSGLKIKDVRTDCIPFAIPLEKKTEMLSFVNLSLLNIREQRDLLDMIDILAGQLKWAIVELFSDPGNKADTMKRFKNKICILRRGMKSKQEAPIC